MAKSLGWATIFLAPLYIVGILVLSACGAPEDEKPAKPVVLNHDPQKGWVYKGVEDPNDPYWNFDLRYQCVGDNLYIENGNTDDGTKVITNAGMCKGEPAPTESGL
jgi:hypothetical protein